MVPHLSPESMSYFYLGGRVPRFRFDRHPPLTFLIGIVPRFRYCWPYPSCATAVEPGSANYSNNQWFETSGLELGNGADLCPRIYHIIILLANSQSLNPVNRRGRWMRVCLSFRDLDGTLQGVRNRPALFLTVYAIVTGDVSARASCSAPNKSPSDPNSRLQLLKWPLHKNAEYRNLGGFAIFVQRSICFRYLFYITILNDDMLYNLFNNYILRVECLLMLI